MLVRPVPAVEYSVANKLLLQAKAVAALELTNPEKTFLHNFPHVLKMQKIYSNLHGGKNGFGPPIPFMTDMICRGKYTVQIHSSAFFKKKIDCFPTCFLIHSIRDSAFSP